MYIFGTHFQEYSYGVSKLDYNYAIAYAVAIQERISLSKTKIIAKGLTIPETLGKGTKYDITSLYEYLVQLTNAELDEVLGQIRDKYDLSYSTKLSRIYKTLLENLAQCVENSEIGFNEQLMIKIIDLAERTVQTTNIEQIIQNIIMTPIVKQIIRNSFIAQFNSYNPTASLANRENYYMVEDLLLEILVNNNYVGKNKLEGDSANLNGLIVNRIKIFVKEKKRDLFRLLGQTGTKSKDEEDYNVESQSYQQVESKQIPPINFHETMELTSWMQENIFAHSVGNSAQEEFKDSSWQELDAILKNKVNIEDTSFYRKNIINKEYIDSQGTVKYYISLANVVSLLQDYDLIERLTLLKKSVKYKHLADILDVQPLFLRMKAVYENTSKIFSHFAVEGSREVHYFRDKSKSDIKYARCLDVFDLLYNYARNGLNDDNLRSLIRSLQSRAKVNTAKASVFPGEKKTLSTYYDSLPFGRTQAGDKYVFSTNDWNLISTCLEYVKKLNNFLEYMSSMEYTIHDLNPKSVLSKKNYINYHDLESCILLYDENKDLKIDEVILLEIERVIKAGKDKEIYIDTEQETISLYSSQFININLIETGKRDKVITPKINKKVTEEEKYLDISVLYNWYNDTLSDFTGISDIIKDIGTFIPIKDENDTYNNLENNVQKFMEKWENLQQYNNILYIPYEESNQEDNKGWNISVKLYDIIYYVYNRFHDNISEEEAPYLDEIFSWARQVNYNMEDEYGEIYTCTKWKHSSIAKINQKTLECLFKNKSSTNLTGYKTLDNALKLIFKVNTKQELIRSILVLCKLYNEMYYATEAYIKRVFGYRHLIERNQGKTDLDNRYIYGEHYNEILVYLTIEPYKFLYIIHTESIAKVKSTLLDWIDSQYLDVVESESNVRDYEFLDTVIERFKSLNKHFLESFAQEYEHHRDLVYNNYFFGANRSSEVQAKSLIKTLLSRSDFYIASEQYVSIRETISREDNRKLSVTHQNANNMGETSFRRINGFTYKNDEPVIKIDKKGNLLVLHESGIFYGIGKKGELISDRSKKKKIF